MDPKTPPRPPSTLAPHRSASQAERPVSFEDSVARAASSPQYEACVLVSNAFALLLLNWNSVLEDTSVPL